MDLFSDKRIFTVSKLTALLRGIIEETFAHVWVEGEISNFSVPASGHLYFTLKDAGSQLRCVMFRASARALKFKPRDGMGIIVRGRLSIYEQRGEYQLIVDYIEPRGVGALQMAFIQLKERLAKEGLFAEAHKKPLPRLPQRIGIVTSATGAAIHDILQVLNRRFANVEVLLYPVKVQGEGAAAEIAAAIKDFNVYGKIDVIIVGRGGGSLEDLWAFNEETVARAIYNSRIPVITAIGHELDFTIADFVADLRAPTPSAAAEMVVKSKDELTAQVQGMSHRLRHAMTRRLSEKMGQVNSLARGLKNPVMLLGHLSQRVDDLTERLERGAKVGVARHHDRLLALVRHLRYHDPALRVERCREKLVMLSGHLQVRMRHILDRRHEQVAVSSHTLQALSPLHTLARGYSIARKIPLGDVVRSGIQLQQGDQLEVVLHEGKVICRVEEASPKAVVDSGGTSPCRVQKP